MAVEQRPRATAPGSCSSSSCARARRLDPELTLRIRRTIGAQTTAAARARAGRRGRGAAGHPQRQALRASRPRRGRGAGGGQPSGRSPTPIRWSRSDGRWRRPKRRWPRATSTRCPPTRPPSTRCGRSGNRCSGSRASATTTTSSPSAAPRCRRCASSPGSATASGSSCRSRSLIEAPTVAELAAAVDDPGKHFDPLVLMRSGSGGPPLFLVHSIWGDVLGMRQIAVAMRERRPRLRPAGPGAAGRRAAGRASRRWRRATSR